MPFAVQSKAHQSQWTPHPVPGCCRKLNKNWNKVWVKRKSSHPVRRFERKTVPKKTLGWDMFDPQNDKNSCTMHNRSGPALVWHSTFGSSPQKHEISSHRSERSCLYPLTALRISFTKSSLPVPFSAENGITRHSSGSSRSLRMTSKLESIWLFFTLSSLFATTTKGQPL